MGSKKFGVVTVWELASHTHAYITIPLGTKVHENKAWGNIYNKIIQQIFRTKEKIQRKRVVRWRFQCTEYFVTWICAFSYTLVSPICISTKFIRQKWRRELARWNRRQSDNIFRARLLFIHKSKRLKKIDLTILAVDHRSERHRGTSFH